MLRYSQREHNSIEMCRDISNVLLYLSQNWYFGHHNWKFSVGKTTNVQMHCSMCIQREAFKNPNRQIHP